MTPLVGTLLICDPDIPGKDGDFKELRAKFVIIASKD